MHKNRVRFLRCTHIYRIWLIFQRLDEKDQDVSIHKAI
jgi:hypothetical protein